MGRRLIIHNAGGIGSRPTLKFDSSHKRIDQTMSKIYDTIVTKAAEELKSAMYEGARRGSYGMPTVYAIPTTEEADGQVVVVPYGGEAPARGIEIKPNSNHASQHTSWLTTPYDYVRSILWQALHNQPILPLERQI